VPRPRIRRWFQKSPDELSPAGRTLGAEVDWAAFPWPRPDDCDVPKILNALRAVVDARPTDWDQAARMVRFAVGNEHRGTVYPAAVAMTEQLLAVAARYPGTPRWVALGVLESWWSGYGPEPGLATYFDADGIWVGVLWEIQRRIAGASELLASIATSPNDPAAAAVARDLLTVIPLGWGYTVNQYGVPQSWGGRINPDGTVDFPRR
jgi:hypothetical protein